ncbi:MAG: leucine-rich repeat protein [Ruminococcus sp.]|nr:leucine-rich repeat protein [Ruminococcus sp.]
MKTLTKSTSVILALLMLLGVFCAFPMTAGALISGDWEYSVNEDGTTATITGYNGSDTALAIPSKIGGKTVTVIGEYAFYNRRTITKITIPATVKELEKGAFDECAGLSDLTIPDGVSKIGGFAFFGCTSLKQMFVPASAMFIGNYSLGYYNNKGSYAALDDFTIYGSPGDSSCDYADQEGFKFVWLKDSTGSDYFSYNDTTKTLTITGDSDMRDYNSTDDQAPWSSYSMRIEKIVVKEGVTRISAWAFLLCAGVKSFTAPESLKSIGEGAFSFCTDLRTADLKNVTSVETGAFSFCGALTSVKFPKVKKLYASAFTYTGIKEATLPASCASAIGAFSSTDSLKKLKVVNKKCALEGKADDYTYGKDALPEKTVITGYKDSTAHKYAKKYTRKFNYIKEANTMTVTAKKTVTANSKKETKINKAVIVKKAQGKLSFKTNNKKVKIKSIDNLHTGTCKMIVAKGLKKGKTVTVKVTVSAMGSAAYKPLKKTVKIKIIVK